MAELVTFEEACKLRGVTRHELWKRVIRCSMLTELEVQEAVNEYERLLKGLAAASEGACSLPEVAQKAPRMVHRSGHTIGA